MCQSNPVVEAVYKYSESSAKQIVVIGPNGLQLCSFLQALRCWLPCRHTVILIELVTEIKAPRRSKGSKRSPSALRVDLR